MDQAGFKLSRVYAEGWNMARKISQAGKNPADVDSDRLNPYSSDPEHARWDEGFAGALAGPKG